MNNRLLYLFALMNTVLLLGSANTYAQRNELGAQFFQNQYLLNPAMAAVNDGWEVNLGYRQQFEEVFGAASMQVITAAYRFKKVGLAINASNDKIGLLQRTRVMATYSYHLPLNGDNEELHFGLSMGTLNERIDEHSIIGDEGDPLIGRFNERGMYADGDFGIAYTNKELTLQVSLPNLRTAFIKEDQNVLTNTVFFSAISYKVGLGNLANVFTVEPKLSYRALKGYEEDMIDVGGLLNFDQFSLQAIYHNSKSITVGFNIYRISEFSFLGLYNTDTSALSRQGENIELGIQWAL